MARRDVACLPFHREHSILLFNLARDIDRTPSELTLYLVTKFTGPPMQFTETSDKGGFDCGDTVRVLYRIDREIISAWRVADRENRLGKFLRDFAKPRRLGVTRMIK